MSISSEIMKFTPSTLLESNNYSSLSEERKLQDSTFHGAMQVWHINAFCRNKCQMAMLIFFGNL